MAKIAFIEVTSTVSYGGVQTAVWQLAIALHDMGHEITVIGGEGQIRADLGGRNITVHTFPFRSREKVIDLGTRFRKLAERLSFARNARKHVAEAGYDWVILAKPFDFFWPWILPSNRKPKFAFLSEGTDFFLGDRFLGKKIDAWLACSHFNGWQIKSRYKRYPAVIFNGVDTTRFVPMAPDQDLRSSLGVAPDETLFAFAGRLVGWKGLSVAIDALSQPMLDKMPVKLLIIGNGPQRRELEQMVRQKNLSQRVIFHGPVPHHELPRYYSAADVGVFPSTADEAFGITIAEAMGCGRPVIGSYIGGIPEVVGNEGNCGLLFSPGNAVELAQSMHVLASSPELREAMGKAARDRVASLYTWELSAKRMLMEMTKK